MDNLSGLFAFVRAAETSSFAAASRLLGISPSAVGKSIARMETRLGVRLFQRSTRKISLTHEGLLFFQRCRQVLDELENAQTELMHARQAPQGRLRISLPALGYRLLAPILPGFIEAYPQITLDVDFSDRMADVIEAGFDAVIRSGELSDSRLQARRIGHFRFVACASPDYFARKRMPAHPRELREHVCLHFRYPTTGKLQGWGFDDSNLEHDLKQSAGFVFNNTEAVLAAASRGVGIAYIPTFVAHEALQSGRLVPTLREFEARQGTFWIVWPSSRHMLPRLRVCIDYFCAHMTIDPQAP
jgi:DNA-binding transcriptional LysR family regulator